MSALSIYRSRSTPRKQAKRLWISVMLVLAMTLAAIALVAAQAQAGSFDQTSPEPVLMKGKAVLQKGHFYGDTWNYYDSANGTSGWVWSSASGTTGFPHADLVRVGSRLHIRLNKPQRPETFTIKAYPRVDEYGMSAGEVKRLNTTLRRVERDGKTVAWNVFFRVNQSDRHYYLDTHGVWKRVPGTHISYGEGSWSFHVKTTD